MRSDRAREWHEYREGFNGGNLHGFGLRSVRVVAPCITLEDIGIGIAAKTRAIRDPHFPIDGADPGIEWICLHLEPENFDQRLLDQCRGDMNRGNEAGSEIGACVAPPRCRAPGTNESP